MASAFNTVLCALDATPESQEAARQAVLLAAPDASVTFLAVVADMVTHLDEGPLLDPDLAREAVERAAQLARARDLKTSTRIVQGDNPGRVLVDASRDFDVLAVGTHGHSRAARVLIGSTASAALHAASAPVLVAREPPDGVAFPGDVLVATDGSPDAERGVRLAAAIARCNGARITIVRVDDGRSSDNHSLAEHIVLATEATGVEPAVIDQTGDAREHIVQAARSEGAALLVMGSRGHGGLRALGSVSERVAHEAPCSVLVTRPRSKA